MLAVMIGTYEGKRGLVLGVANRRSIAWAIAKRLAHGGAELAFTYQGERIEKSVRELAESVSSPLVTECDVRSDEDVARVFREVASAFDGGLDLLVHSVAFAAAEDLEGRFTDTPRDRFWMALDVSAYSLVAVARAAEPLMAAGAGGGAVSPPPPYHGRRRRLRGDISAFGRRPERDRDDPVRGLGLPRDGDVGPAAPRACDLDHFRHGRERVEVRDLRIAVSPRGADRSGSVDEERRAHRYVLVAAELARDSEAVDRIRVPIGEKREVQVERLDPGDVRPRRVARDAEPLDTHFFELRAPVTQELHLVCSGGRPVEEVEEKQTRWSSCVTGAR